MSAILCFIISFNSYYQVVILQAWRYDNQEYAYYAAYAVYRTYMIGNKVL